LATDVVILTHFHFLSGPHIGHRGIKYLQAGHVLAVGDISCEPLVTAYDRGGGQSRPTPPYLES
jgi:hypothetical protein